MKTTVIFLFFCLLMPGMAFSQEKKSDNKYQIVDIKASMTCNACKEKIEKNIAFEKGVKDIDIDLESKIVSIKYNTEKTSPENLVKAIQDLKYSAEVVKIHDCNKKDSKKSCCDKTKKSDHKCCDKKKKSDKSCDHDKNE